MIGKTVFSSLMILCVCGRISLFSDAFKIDGFNFTTPTIDYEVNRTANRLFVPPDDDGTTRKIIKYKNKFGKSRAISMGTKIFHDFVDDQYIVMKINPSNVSTLLNDDNIETIEDDTYYTEQGILEEILDPNQIQDLFNTSHHYRQLAEEQIPYGIRMVQAPAVSVGKTRIQVCLVDTGINIGHPDFNKNNIKGSSRKSSADNKLLLWNQDVRGHGTHIAGTIAAKSNNNYGVRGIGNIPLYITRGLTNTGSARETDVIQALDQCVKNGSKIISLSLSGGSMSSLMKQQLDKLYSANILVVAAAGNDGKRIGMYPASYNKVISVGAVDQDGKRWSGSNFGPWIELTAPGVNIVSLGKTSQGAYTLAIYTGTSMATPHVAGAAALLWSHYPKCTNTQIRYALAYTALDKGTVKGCDDYYGYGIIQIKRAWNFLRQYPCSSTSPWGKSIGDGTCSAIDRRPSLKKLRRQLSYNDDNINMNE